MHLQGNESAFQLVVYQISSQHAVDVGPDGVVKTYLSHLLLERLRIYQLYCRKLYLLQYSEITVFADNVVCISRNSAVYKLVVVRIVQKSKLK